MSSMLEYAREDARYTFEWGRRNGWHLKETLEERLLEVSVSDRARHELRLTQLLNGIDNHTTEWPDRDEPWSFHVGVTPGSVVITALIQDGFYEEIINDYLEAQRTMYVCESVEQLSEFYDQKRNLVACKVVMRPRGIVDI